MYATLREYEGIKDPAQATQPLLDGLLAEMQALPGFIAYYFVDVGEAGDRMISLSVFESSEAAEESNRVAAGCGWLAGLRNTHKQHPRRVAWMPVLWWLVPLLNQPASRGEKRSFSGISVNSATMARNSSPSRLSFSISSSTTRSMQARCSATNLTVSA